VREREGGEEGEGKEGEHSTRVLSQVCMGPRGGGTRMRFSHLLEVTLGCRGPFVVIPPRQVDAGRVVVEHVGAGHCLVGKDGEGGAAGGAQSSDNNHKQGTCVRHDAGVGGAGDGGVYVWVWAGVCGVLW